MCYVLFEIADSINYTETEVAGKAIPVASFVSIITRLVCSLLFRRVVMVFFIFTGQNF